MCKMPMPKGRGAAAVRLATNSARQMSVGMCSVEMLMLALLAPAFGYELCCTGYRCDGTDLDQGDDLQGNGGSTLATGQGYCDNKAECLFLNWWPGNEGAAGNDRKSMRLRHCNVVVADSDARIYAK